MLTNGQAANDIISFLQNKGFCPKKVGLNQMGGQIMLQWIHGRFSDEEVVKALENLEILSGKSFRSDLGLNVT